MTLAIILVIVGAIFALAGFIGGIIPAIPGPPLSYVAFLMLFFAGRAIGVAAFHHPAFMLIFFGILAVLFLVLDNVFPMITGKKYGTSKAGTWGSIIGMIAGMFLGPIFIFIGVFVGALIGELIAGKEQSEALRAGWGTFLGTIFGIAVKLAFAGAVIILYIPLTIRLFRA